MKHTLIACIFLRPSRPAVSLSSALLTALLFALASGSRLRAEERSLLFIRRACGPGTTGLPTTERFGTPFTCNCRMQSARIDAGRTMISTNTSVTPPRRTCARGGTKGPALCALSGTWNDRHIATGSIARHQDRWWMVYTARGTRGDGVGLVSSAGSEPLGAGAQRSSFCPHRHMGRREVEGGVFPLGLAGPVSPMGLGSAIPISFPKPDAGGWFTMILCSRILDVPMGGERLPDHSEVPVI